MVDTEQLKDEVYEIVMAIPYGTVLTYGEIARLAGYPNHSRLAGRVMRRGGGLRIGLFCQFYAFLACDVLYLKRYHIQAVERFLDFRIQCLLVVRAVALAKHAEGREFLFLIINNVYSPEADDAAKVGREGLGMHLVLADDGERSLVAMAYRVNLVAAEGGMKIQLVVMVDIAERHSVRIAVIIEKG